MQNWHNITLGGISVDRLQRFPLRPASFVANVPDEFAYLAAVAHLQHLTISMRRGHSSVSSSALLSALREYLSALRR